MAPPSGYLAGAPASLRSQRRVHFGLWTTLANRGVAGEHGRADGGGVGAESGSDNLS